MKTNHANETEIKITAKIEKDLERARREGRFDDVLVHFEEIVAVHKHTENEALKLRCVLLLGGAKAVAPPALQRSAA